MLVYLEQLNVEASKPPVHESLELLLHREILLFRDYVFQFQEKTQRAKDEVVRRICECTRTSLRTASIEVYGSHATKLSLPWSDIDLVLKPGEDQTN